MAICYMGTYSLFRPVVSSKSVNVCMYLRSFVRMYACMSSYIRLNNIGRVKGMVFYVAFNGLGHVATRWKSGTGKKFTFLPSTTGLVSIDYVFSP